MPDSTGYLVRPIQKGEAGYASLFGKNHVAGSLNISAQFCLHHASGIFICLDEADKWQGMIVTYLSPEYAGTAVIESIIIAAQTIRFDIASLLLEHSFQYYKNRCVFKMLANDSTIKDASELLPGSFLFKTTSFENETVYRRQLLPEKICLHNRRMRPRMNTINGDVNEDTLFEYFQKDDVVWGVYSGGTIVRGILLGRMARNGDIDFQYIQLNVNNEINTGVSHSSTEFLNDGRIVLYEDWEWTGNRSGSGRSVIEEIKD